MLHHIMKLTLLFCIILSVGCASVEKDSDWTAEEIHVEARKHLEAKDWEKAIDYYHKIEQRHPYSKYAEQSKLDLIYSYYNNNQLKLAISTAADFTRLYPTHPRVDYAYYFGALAMFDTSTSLLRRLSRINPINFDTDPAKESFSAFNELITRFPDSKYVMEAQSRMREILNIIAGHEINIGRYYLSQGAYVAALNRAKYVIENYPEVVSVEDALGIMLSVYKNMGLMALYEDTRRVLDQNFPTSIYLSLDTK